MKTRWKKELKSQKKMQYSNIYNILTENVNKAKTRMANLANKGDTSPGAASRKKAKEDQETLERILRQKREYETLLRAHENEQKMKGRARDYE